MRATEAHRVVDPGHAWQRFHGAATPPVWVLALVGCGTVDCIARRNPMRPTDKTRNQDLACSRGDHSTPVAGVKPIDLARDLAVAEQRQAREGRARRMSGSRRDRRKGLRG
jgi:hypothetical protein